MNLEPSRRFRFRWAFSLKTLFVLVLLAAIPMAWLAWQVQIVREREAILAELQSLVGVDGFSYTIDGREQYDAALSIYDVLLNSQYSRVPTVRLLLGDESYGCVCIRKPINSRLAGRLEIGFPEAELWAEYDARTNNYYAWRDSLYTPLVDRGPNVGTFFKTGLLTSP